MNPATIVKAAAQDGVKLALSPTGTIKASGDQAAVSRWLPIIREQKSGIVDVLRRDTGDDLIKSTQSDAPVAKTVVSRQADPGLRYAVEAHDDDDPDAVILTVAIRGEAACEIRIPKSRYDAFALLELLDKHATRVTLQ
jgi:hypothetical protein